MKKVTFSTKMGRTSPLPRSSIFPEGFEENKKYPAVVCHMSLYDVPK